MELMELLVDLREDQVYQRRKGPKKSSAVPQEKIPVVLE